MKNRARNLEADQDEIARFARDSARWWDESGPFAPLHRLNPVRLGWIRDRIGAHFGLETAGRQPFKGLKILDAGCGGGLVCEPMARLGAAVTGIDADAQAIDIAMSHAAGAGLDIAYRVATTHDMAGKKGRTETFDVVLALEIIEHVSDQAAFVESCLGLCRPGGLAIFSTLNRTPKSFALGIVAAEYVLRWVPRGTHDWKKFVKPSELAAMIRDHGGSVDRLSGIIFNPLKNEFALHESDLDVNYILTASRR